MAQKKHHIETFGDDLSVLRYIADRERFRSNADVVHWLLKILNKYWKIEEGRAYWRFVDDDNGSPCQEASSATIPLNNSLVGK